jgi:1,4-dihydroxy-2-naphthoate octaprenyltransferase
MDTLQERFRTRASEILQKTPTMSVAIRCGRAGIIETCYMVGDSDELYCVMKPNPAIVEAVRDDAAVAFSATLSFPNQQVQGTGRAFFLGGMDGYPHIREQVLGRVPEASAFLSTIRNLGVLKILPDQLTLTDDGNLGLGPRPVYVPEAAQGLPDHRRRWLQAVGVACWPLVLIPVLVAALLAGNTALEISWWLLAPVLIVAILLLVGTMLLAAFSGFRQQSERSQVLGSSRLLREGLLPAPVVRRAGLVCLAIGTALGLFLVGVRGSPILLIGLVGVVGALLYAGWPIYLTRREFEEGVVFACLGPLAVLGTQAVLTGYTQVRPLLVSLPIGLLAASILYAGRLDTFPEDLQAKRRTLAVCFGWGRARQVFALLIGLPYALVAVLILAGVLPEWAWLTFLSLPLAAGAGWAVWKMPAERASPLTGLDLRVGRVHLAFGVLLMLGLWIG